MIRRSGATLIETLIAIFVCAIGLLAIFALFPVGAASMAQALRDSRCAQASLNATAIAKFQQMASDTNVSSAFSSPVGGTWPSLSSTSDGPSYPVYVDPFGTNLVSTSVAPTLLTPFSVNPGIPRVSPSYITGYFQQMQNFTLLDDITFTPAGLAGTAGTTVERGGRYSWTYMLQQPNSSYPSLVNLTVVVYVDRSPSVLGENSYYVDFVQGTNTVTIFLNQLNTGKEKPHIRPGGWILDSTTVWQDPNLPLTSPNTPQPDPHGFFYRVVNVTDTYATDPFGVLQPALLLELQTNIKKSSYTNPAKGVFQEGSLTIIDNVVEVFDKGPL